MQLEFPLHPHLLHYTVILTGRAHARVQFYLGLGKKDNVAKICDLVVPAR